MQAILHGLMGKKGISAYETRRSGSDICNIFTEWIREPRVSLHRRRVVIPRRDRR
jgi:hypothetical protein